ncbi:MAG: hypothetical protein ILN61_02935 [Lachnospiraceae bacterium]|nr:hypothetical protein [Lachnospiraceae bacterium]
MAPDGMKREIAAALAAVADRMLANVTGANGWNALDADGRPDAKGLLKMWNVRWRSAWTR